MKWLQLSDLHFGYENNAVQDMREKLIVKLHEVEHIDYIFITGDLRYAKAYPNKYPDDIETYISRIADVLSIDKDHIFVVPGNHDVSRSKSRTSIIEVILQRYSTIDGNIDADYLHTLQDSMFDFSKLYNILTGMNYQNTHFYKELDGFNLIHLNTSLICGRDCEDGSLVVGMNILRNALQSMNKQKPAIVLAHHGFDCFTNEEQRALEIFLKECNTLLYLCGHKHKASCQNISVSRQGINLWEYLCGTNMDKTPHVETTDMDFFIGEVDLVNLDGSITAYKWSRDNCNWMPDSDFSYRQGQFIDGIHFYSMNKDDVSYAAKRAILAVEKHYIEYISSECTKIQFDRLTIDNSLMTTTCMTKDIFVSRTFRKIACEDNTLSDPITCIDERDVSLCDILNIKTDHFRAILQAELGSGKTTLMKRIALSYCLPEYSNQICDGFNQENIFPIWLLCRTYDTKKSLVENIKSLPQQAGFNDVDEITIEAFYSLVKRKIAHGSAILIVDGLDEIDDINDRLCIIKDIDVMYSQNPKLNVLITTRTSGYSEIESIKGYDRYDLNPFSKSQISEFCLKIYGLLYGKNNHQMIKVCNDLIMNVLNDPALYKMAQNPLLLTTLLFVHRRYGKMPRRRVDLYQEATRVLVETWDGPRGKSTEDFEKTKYQLSYIAYNMVNSGNIKQIPKSAILSLVEEARNNRSVWFQNHKETPIQFLKIVEQRTTLLIHHGSSIAREGEKEDIYEFRHLGFRDYLAAVAIVNKYYPKAKRTDRPCHKLKQYVENPNLNEVIIFSLIMDIASAWAASEVSDMVKYIFTCLERNRHIYYSNISRYLERLLFQIILEEAPLTDAMMMKIFKNIFQVGYSSGDVDIYNALLQSKNAKVFEDYINASDHEHKSHYGKTLVSIIKNGQKIDYYSAYRQKKAGDENELIAAMRELRISIWLGEDWVGHRIKTSEIEGLVHDMLQLTYNANNKNVFAALRLLRIIMYRNKSLRLPSSELEHIFSVLVSDFLVSKNIGLFTLVLAFDIDKNSLTTLSPNILTLDVKTEILNVYARNGIWHEKQGAFWFLTYNQIWDFAVFVEEMAKIISVVQSEVKIEFLARVIKYSLLLILDEGESTAFYDAIKMSIGDARVTALSQYAFDAYAEHNYILTERIFLVMKDLTDDIPQLSEINLNLAYLKRRQEALNVNTPVFTLLNTPESTETSAFRCINMALCYIQGFECREDFEKAINILKTIREEIIPACDWWSDINNVGEPECNLVLYLLSKLQIIPEEPNDILEKRLKIAKENYVVPENIDELIIKELAQFDSIQDKRHM